MFPFLFSVSGFSFPVSISFPFPAFPYAPTEATEHLLNVAGTSQLVNPEILPMASPSDQSGELCCKDMGSQTKQNKIPKQHQNTATKTAHSCKLKYVALVCKFYCVYCIKL